MKKQNKNTRQQFEREISSKTELEHYLKKVVDKVLKARRKERESQAHRKSATKFYITALDSTPNLAGGPKDDELTQEERERVIELLLGKDKVIQLLYDRDVAGAVPTQQQQERPMVQT